MPEELPTRYYAVNDRPVKIVGGWKAFAFDWKTGAFIHEQSYALRVLEVGIGKDVDSFSEQEFEELIASLRAPIAKKLQTTALAWERTGDGEFPYRCRLGERALTLRVNDFPAEPLYTLIVDDQVIFNLEDWPRCWQRPE